MGNTTGSNVDSVDIELDFEIDPDRGQEGIRKFGYYFNTKGECRSIKSDERVGRFPSQQEYEEFGAALEEYIFFLLRDQYKMDEKLITSNKKDNDNDSDNDDNDNDDNDDDDVEMKSKPNKPTTKKGKKSKKKKSADNENAKQRIYLSPEYGTKETLLLLIPGSGAVRAGQWARSICINDNLAAGCMYPFIHAAYQRDWGVVLFDPNGRSDMRPKDSVGHVRYVYDKYIEGPYLSQKDCKIKNILIVCHSAGGWATTELLNNKSKHLLPRIRGIAGTDTFFGRAQNKKVQAVYKKYIVNWVTSSEDLGTILSNTVPKRVSAGHRAHEYTSASAFQHIFKFFDAMLKMANMQTVQSEDNGLKGTEKETSKEVESEQKGDDKETAKEEETKNTTDDKEQCDENADENDKEMSKEEEQKPDTKGKEDKIKENDDENQNEEKPDKQEKEEVVTQDANKMDVDESGDKIKEDQDKQDQQKANDVDKGDVAKSEDKEKPDTEDKEEVVAKDENQMDVDGKPDEK